MNLNLDTIILFVQDVEKLKSFYIDILHLELVEESPSQWVLLKAGNCQVGLHKIGDQYLDQSKRKFKFDSNCKLVFEAPEDLHNLRQQLLNKNVVLNEIKTYDNYNYWVCDGEDPEGNVFQLKLPKSN